MSLDSLKRLVMKNPPAPAARDPRRSDRAIAGGRRAGENTNPYLNARRTWNDHVGAVVAARRMWQIVGVLALLIVLVAVGGVISIGEQSKFVPFIVEHDTQKNSLVAMGPLTTAAKADQAEVASAIAHWAECARTVTPDVALQRKCVFDVYAMIQPADPAAQKMNEYMNGSDASNPFKRAENELVNAEVKTVIAQTSNTLEVDWVETTRDRKGAPLGNPVTWRLLATWYVAEPTKDTKVDQLIRNPASIYIRDYSWSRVL